MERPDAAPLRWNDLLQTLVTYRWRVFACIAAFVGLAVCVALITPRQWRATMTVWLVPPMIERNQPGEFPYDADRQLAMQLENFRLVALSDDVLAEVLRQAPPPRQAPARPADALAGLRSQIGIRAPKGAEFGKSEIFHVSVDDQDPARALALSKALKDIAQARYRHLSQQKSENLVAQAEEALRQAHMGLAEATSRLERLEAEAGRDLHDLRVLASGGAAELLLKKALLVAQESHQAVEADVRERRQRLEDLQRSLAGLSDAELVNLPTSLLAGGEDLRAAKANLITLAAQLARLTARFTPAHPQVRAAQRELADAQHQFRQAVEALAASLADDLAARQARLDFLTAEARDLRTRLDRLERLRLGYAAASHGVDQALQTVREAQRRLDDARQVCSRARRAELLLYVDNPKVETEPIGPKRREHLLAGVVLGLLAGIGVALVSRYSRS